MRPRVIFVVAYDKGHVIGKNGTMPWHLPADLRHFKALTIGKTVVMGRKTYQSIGKPLKLRRNVVITRDPEFYAEGVEIARSAEDVLASSQGAGEIAIVGGADIFKLFDPYVDSIYATEIDANVGGDVVFTLPARAMTRYDIGVQDADDENAFAMKFVRYDLTVHPEHISS